MAAANAVERDIISRVGREKEDSLHHSASRRSLPAFRFDARRVRACRVHSGCGGASEQHGIQLRHDRGDKAEERHRSELYRAYRDTALSKECKTLLHPVGEIASSIESLFCNYTGEVIHMPPKNTPDPS